jgi:hypothetical protein
MESMRSRGSGNVIGNAVVGHDQARIGAGGAGRAVEPGNDALLGSDRSRLVVLHDI